MTDRNWNFVHNQASAATWAPACTAPSTGTTSTTYASQAVQAPRPRRRRTSSTTVTRMASAAPVTYGCRSRLSLTGSSYSGERPSGTAVFCT